MLLQHTTTEHAQASAPQTYKTTRRLNILSWNIGMLPWLSRFNGNAGRASRLAEVLEASGYHILVFQEAFSGKCRQVIKNKLDRQYPFHYGPFNERLFSFRTNSGLWVLSRIPLTLVDEIVFKEAKSFDAVARKGAVLLEGQFDGAPFQLLATHLQAEDHDELRGRQCLEIREQLIDRYTRPDVPQFLCGDFNVDKYETERYRRMLESLDACDGHISGPIQVTFDEVDNRLAFRPGGKRRTLDYTLVRNAELLDSMERRVQTFLTHVGELEAYLSDHYAMDFSVRFADRDESDDHGFAMS